MRDPRLEVKSLDHRELFEPQVAALTRDFSKPSISPEPQVKAGLARPPPELQTRSSLRWQRAQVGPSSVH